MNSNNSNNQTARPAFNIPSATVNKSATDAKKDASSSSASNSQPPSSIGAFGFSQASQSASGIAVPTPSASSSASHTSSVFGLKSDSTSATGGNSTSTLDAFGSTSTNAPKLASSTTGFGNDSYGFAPSAYGPGASSHSTQPAVGALKPTGESLLKTSETAYHQRPDLSSQFRGITGAQLAAPPSFSLGAAKPVSGNSSASSSASSTSTAGGLFDGGSKVDESVSGIGSFLQKPAPTAPSGGGMTCSPLIAIVGLKKPEEQAKKNGASTVAVGKVWLDFAGAKPTFGVPPELPKKTEQPLSKRAEEAKKEASKLAAPLKKEEPRHAEVKKEASKKEESKQIAKKEEPKAAASKKEAAPKKPAEARKRAAPTELRHSTRERKQVKLENATAPPPAAKLVAAPIFSAGHGSKFADIPHISRELAKRKSADSALQLVHRLVYRRVGEAGKRKEDLRKFNGLAGDKVGRNFDCCVG